MRHFKGTLGVACLLFTQKQPEHDEECSGCLLAWGFAKVSAHLTETGKPARQLTANVVAVADFAKKGLTFKTSNTHFHTLEQGARVSTPAAGYDMSGSASWAVNSNTFKGEAATAQHGFKGSLNGKFYGTKVDEIGGTYGLSNGNQQLIGGYGAKRQ